MVVDMDKCFRQNSQHIIRKAREEAATKMYVRDHNSLAFG